MFIHTFHIKCINLAKAFRVFSIVNYRYLYPHISVKTVYYSENEN